jgi:hypothetical protein
VKFAVTVRACVIKTMHGSVPVQAPLHPVNLLALGVAVRVTLVASSNVEVQVAPQSILVGLDEIEPFPVPVLLMVRFQIGVKLAVTLRARVIETVQVLVPVQSPLQPANRLVSVGVAVRVTLVASSNVCTQSGPQLVLPGTDAIEPVPVPVLFVVRIQIGVKFARTVRACVIETVQVLVPVQSPLQPVNRLPLDAVAVSVMLVSHPLDVEHVVPQLIPAGFDVMTPVPVPVLFVVRIGRARMLVTASVLFQPAP